jgi:hypothetical protein
MGVEETGRVARCIAMMITDLFNHTSTGEAAAITDGVLIAIEIKSVDKWEAIQQVPKCKGARSALEMPIDFNLACVFDVIRTRANRIVLCRKPVGEFTCDIKLDNSWMITCVLKTLSEMRVIIKRMKLFIDLPWLDLHPRFPVQWALQ